MDLTRTSADREWVRSVVAQYERQLTTYAVHVLKDVEKARDAVQDTFVKLCGVDRSEVEPRLAQWLFTVCRNLAIDVMRKDRRMFLLGEGQAERYEDALPGPHDRVEQDDSVSVVLRSMADLPETQQEVIRLKFQHGLSYKQIGEVLNLTVTNVGFLIHTGLKTLRQRLADGRPVGSA
jgi:RNA polymerase sigma-70 factor (ECF subfamily)